jgi:hypothetical protein
VPYIEPAIRPAVDTCIEDIARTIQVYGPGFRPGMLNYVVSSLLSKSYSLRYADINEAMGVLSCVQQEFYRRVAAGYEDIKAVENGDVY